jgi:transposase
MDMHKRFSEVVALDDAGNVVGDHKQLDHENRDGIARYFRDLPGPAVVTLEATRNWYWLYEYLETLANCHQIKMAHPRKVRLIAEAPFKSDVLDAEKLAQLERANFLPQAYVPPRDIRDNRELLRYRIALVHERSCIKNRVHAILDKLGIFHPFSDLFGGRGRQFLSGIELRPVYRVAFDGYLRTVDHLDREIRAATRLIKAALKDDCRADRLMTIPGISYLTAYLLLCEIGDIQRFPSAKKLCSYAGITPRLWQSAEHSRQGRITKEGDRYIRWAMIEAAQKVPKYDERMRRFYHRIAYRRGKPKAKIALAHKMLIAVWHVLTYNETYRLETGSTINLSKPAKVSGKA